MTINLNDPEELTLEKVSQFIASCDDSAHRQIRVTQGGIAFISDSVGADHTEGIAFRLETYVANNGYLGVEAAQDANWVRQIYDVLKTNWPEPTSSYIGE
jgi:hypothetical protein